MSHGIGRSGDIAAEQPKAAGSSLMYKLTNYMALDAIKIAGIRRCEACVVVPMATGMSVSLVLLALRQQRPTARYVVWPRLDQKSCFKAICTCGLTPIVIPNIIKDDEIVTNVEALEAAISNNGPESILCVLSTASCFVPRIADKVVDISIICKKFSIPHVINNAYGLQSSKATHFINEAIRIGRVDAFVQSTDKNFLVPIGGAIIASPEKSIVDLVSQNYPGRASASPIMDLFITFLSLGKTGYTQLLTQRKTLFQYFHQCLEKFAIAIGERVLKTPGNDISLGITLSTFTGYKGASFLGSMLFSRAMMTSFVKASEPLTFFLWLCRQ